ncbi:hypothetical protein Vafri_20544, partial [Volvox africanus]
SLFLFLHAQECIYASSVHISVSQRVCFPPATLSCSYPPPKPLSTFFPFHIVAFIDHLVQIADGAHAAATDLHSNTQRRVLIAKKGGRRQPLSHATDVRYGHLGGHPCYSSETQWIVRQRPAVSRIV